MKIADFFVAVQVSDTTMQNRITKADNKKITMFISNADISDTGNYIKRKKIYNCKIVDYSEPLVTYFHKQRE